MYGLAYSVIPYWSKENFYYNGDIIGDSFRNCAATWNNIRKYEKMLGFRVTPNQLPVTISPLANSLFCDYTSNESLIIGSITIPNGNKTSFKSKSITIENGFTVANNATLELSTE